MFEQAKFLSVLAAALTLALAASCKRTAEKGVVASQEPLPKFELTLGWGGGFTGGEQGYTIGSDGVVRSYLRHPGGGDSTLWEKSVSTDSLRRWWTELKESGVFEWRANSPGNVYRKLTLVVDDSTLRWVWDPNRPPADMPAKLASWFDRVQRALSKFAEE